MSSEISAPKVAADDFARRFSLRAGNLMWFLGAGASASAGIPTAQDLVWQFKQQLFISRNYLDNVKGFIRTASRHGRCSRDGAGQFGMKPY